MKQVSCTQSFHPQAGALVERQLKKVITPQTGALVLEGH